MQIFRKLKNSKKIEKMRKREGLVANSSNLRHNPVSMPGTFWKKIDLGNSPDDPFGEGLRLVQANFSVGWGELERAAITSCNEERLHTLQSKRSPAAKPAVPLSCDLFPTWTAIRQLFPKNAPAEQYRREYFSLMRRLDSILLRSAFKRWLSAVGDLIRECFQDALEVAVAHPDRLGGKEPSEFAFEVISALIAEVEGRHPRRDCVLLAGLFSDDFLMGFFENPFAPVEKMKPTLATLRTVLNYAFEVQILDLPAQVELPEPRRRRAARIRLLRAKQNRAAVASEEAGSAPMLQLRHLEVPPEKIPVREVVRRLYPALRKAVNDARYYVTEENEKGNRPSAREIAEKFTPLREARDSEITQYVINREQSPGNAAKEMMRSRTGLPDSTIQRYTSPMKPRKTDRSPRELRANTSPNTGSSADASAKPI